MQATAVFILAVTAPFPVHPGFASATALAFAMILIMIAVLLVIAVLQGVGTSGINGVGMTALLQLVVSSGFILAVIPCRT
jgi:solute carrier family 13 (sodium-dependent dicarboxylate transporter), member 2/3/5